MLEASPVDTLDVDSPSKSRLRQALLLTATDRLALPADQQQAYLQLLARGASPAAACLQLGISLAHVAATLESDPEFCSLLEQIQALLSQNVAAALYRSAMEGSVTAQQFYLKNRPPPEWPSPPGEVHSQGLESLTDEELKNEIRAGYALFHSVESNRLGTPVREDKSRGIS